MECINCGETLIGDGYQTVLHCPNSDDHWDKEPDANPVYCDEDNDGE